MNPLMLWSQSGSETIPLSVRGRSPLNPLAHLDPFGGLLMVLTGFGWAKPVPINPLRMKKYRAGISLTALAGPVSNLLAAFVAGIAYNIIICTKSGLMALVSSEVTTMSCVLLLLSFSVSGECRTGSIQPHSYPTS